EEKNVFSSSLNPTVYQVSRQMGRVGVGARNEGSPPPRGVPRATPWLKVRAAEATDGQERCLFKRLTG
ncbi:hypothetical protein CEXT_23751, partial [Caerostris extrusa]